MSREQWLSHSTLLRETIFEGYIANIEPLRVGSGREPPLEAPVDLAVLRIRYGGIDVPYIPGSSLKGVFRSYATSLARHSGIDVCTGLSKETCGETKHVDGKKLNERIDELMRSSDKNAIKVFYENACLMCKIFGSTRYMSKISFSDAYPIDENGQIIDVRTGVRTGIAINRRTGAAQASALYRVEFIEPGARFRFSIRCRNLPNYAIGMLSLVLKRMYEGLIKVGGFKSRGFGAVKVEDLKFKNRDFMKEPSLIMVSLEPGVDKDVDLTGVARLKDGWIISEDKDAWRALEKMIEAWNGFVGKS
ncbi:MAG: CRISPR-associated RAMP protein Csx7 [Candidatus Bathyarchaeota archaeon]|nr:CRISPR-associated RAMP protein Csx7 [Candidatus Bathyarchaeota archaeon]